MKKILLALFFTTSLMAQDFISLYPAGVPNSKPVVNKQSAIKGKDGIERISKVSIPTYRFLEFTTIPCTSWIHRFSESHSWA
jgi:hypothetical protein